VGARDEHADVVGAVLVIQLEPLNRSIYPDAAAAITTSPTSSIVATRGFGHGNASVSVIGTICAGLEVETRRRQVRSSTIGICCEACSRYA
jgi:hypothetical protein